MDEYADIAPFYDLEHDAFGDDLHFYANVVQEGPVLEVGAGTGRVVAPLARRGLEVWGIDPSTSMLSRARRRLADYSNVHLVESTLGQLDLHVRFRTAILSLNLLWHITDLEERARGLQVLHRHVVPSALIVVDLSNPLAMVDRGARGEVRRRFARQTDAGQVLCLSSAFDDAAEQLLMLSLVFDEVDHVGMVRRHTADLELRYIYAAELTELLYLCGFAVQELYGSYDLDPYTETSPNLIALARAD